MKALRLAALVAVITLSCVIAPVGQAAEEEEAAAGPARARVMLVLDASGSMWGRIGNKAKIEIARESIAELIADWDRDVDLGLSAYGHRVKGDCDDIETLIPVGRSNPATVIDAVDALKPKGKTPLSEAVRRAARELRFSEEAATVILVSDGLETCGADPCAVAEELEAGGVDFTAHVIGFDLKKEEQQALRCVADNTGGLFLAAGDAGSLSDVLGKAVETTRVEATKLAERPEPVAEKHGVKFTALYAEGGPAVERNASWRIFLSQEGEQKKGKQVAYEIDATPVFDLDPGRYVAQIKLGATTGEVDFEVRPGESQSINVVLNAGLAALSAKRSEDSDPVTSRLSWRVYQPKADIDGKRRQVAYEIDNDPVLTLPAGRYVLSGKLGSTTATTEFEVRAGERSEVALLLASGVLSAQAVYGEESQPVTGNLSWRIFESKKNISGKRKQVAYEVANQLNVELPAGTYLLRAKRGEAASEQQVEVSANERTETTVVLDAGILAARVAGGNASWRVYSAKKDINGKRRQIAYEIDNDPVLTLPAGKYLVRIERGDQKRESEVEIRAGERTELDVDM